MGTDQDEQVDRLTIWDELGYRPMGSGERKGGLAMLGQILVSLSYLLTYLQLIGSWAHIKMNRLIGLPSGMNSATYLWDPEEA